MENMTAGNHNRWKSRQIEIMTDGNHDIWNT